MGLITVLNGSEEFYYNTIYYNKSPTSVNEKRPKKLKFILTILNYSYVK